MSNLEGEQAQNKANKNSDKLFVHNILYRTHVQRIPEVLFLKRIPKVALCKQKERNLKLQNLKID